MEFDSNKPIFLQIADNFCERILSGDIQQEERIPSVREWGAQIGVNPNTVARSYDELSSEGIIYQKRGIGFFVTSNARDLIRERLQKSFLEDELPQVKRRAELLGIDLKKYL